MEVIDAVNNSNIYDPRFTGYGPNYRAYVEKETGQPRFYYDDINAIRQPNYIVRSNIDFERYADSYGPMQPGEAAGNIYTPNIRRLANDSFMRNTLKYRTDLQERLMRKRNAEVYQRRLAPKHTMGSGINIGCGAFPVSG